MFSAGIALDDVRIVQIAPIGFFAFFTGLELISLCKYRQRISPPCGVFFVVYVTVRNPGFCSWESSDLPLEACEADPGHSAYREIFRQTSFSP